LFDITQVYPDILNVSTTSVDYNRMSADTQGMLSRLNEMILIAETLTYYSDIPVNYRKVQRYGITFISTRYMNIEFMVASKLTTPQYTV
jgi:Na+-transporting NADH:ubiquinone oxidoreductase subunit NqrE